MLSHLRSSRGRWHPEFVHRGQRERDGVWGRWNPAAAAASDDSEKQTHELQYGFAPVPAFWYDGLKDAPEAQRRPRLPGQPVMLHLHGGGYVCGTAAETDLTSSISKSMVAHTPIGHVLSLDYRLAPTAPWPLPLLDAISAYAYLVNDEGVDERDLVIGGDSAGGHLALALTRWLRDEGAKLGLRGPRALVLMSPWSDIGFTHQWGESSFKFNADSDTIDNTFGPFASSLLLRALPSGIMHENEYLSPASRLISRSPAHFSRFPPVFVVHGGAERLAREIQELFARIRLGREHGDMEDTPDHLVSAPDAVHDFAIFPWFAAEAGAVYEEMDGWLRALLGEGSESGSSSEVEVDADEMATSASGPSSPVSPLPLSPLALSLSVTNSPSARDMRRRTSLARRALRDHKSPRLPGHKDTPRQMYADMHVEGLHLLDLEPLDLGAAVVAPFTPFTAQFERGEWDWDGEAWHEFGAGSRSASDDEDEGEEANE
jgi:acetyl esterase/lipase